MSNCLLRYIRFLDRYKINEALIGCPRFYSRRSNSDDGPYKVVTPKKTVKDVQTHLYGDPNYDLLLQSKGFPFFLPGSIGPAWHDRYSTVPSEKVFMKYLPTATSGKVSCQVQECPRVLRQTVCELFPQTGLEHLELSVITLTLRSEKQKLMRYNKELETEKLAQMFLLAANDLCQKLRKAGYWADFINPFSGRPYIQAPKGEMDLYATDEKFRCLDFQIISMHDCKIVTNEEDKRGSKTFVGSLFTSAPSKKSHLETVFDSE